MTDEGVVKSNLDFEGSAPQHHLRLLLGYTTGPWEFDTFGQLVTATNMMRGYVQSFQPYIAQFIPTYNNGYEDLSARIGYRIDDNFTMALSGTHLSSNSLQVSPYPRVQRQVFVSLTGKL